ncbi:MAG: SEL1-like repeat protein [Magnetococcus sp. XQGC-1]
MEDLVTDIRNLAEQGDADAQFKLGFMYASGLAIPKDEQEAIRWFSKSAEQGNAGAEFQLKLLTGTQKP